MITLWFLLQLLEVQVSDMAVYLCVAENKVGTVEKLFSLTVQGKQVYLTVEQVVVATLWKLFVKTLFSLL